MQYNDYEIGPMTMGALETQERDEICKELLDFYYYKCSNIYSIKAGCRRDIPDKITSTKQKTLPQFEAIKIHFLSPRMHLFEYFENSDRFAMKTECVLGQSCYKPVASWFIQVT